MLWVDWAQLGGPSATYDISQDHSQGCTQRGVPPKMASHPPGPLLVEPHIIQYSRRSFLNSGWNQEGQGRTASS